MSETRCTYCRKYCKSINSNQKCADCEKEFNSVVAHVIKRYGGVLKKLAQR